MEPNKTYHPVNTIVNNGRENIHAAGYRIDCVYRGPTTAHPPMNHLQKQKNTPTVKLPNFIHYHHHHGFHRRHHHHHHLSQQRQKPRHRHQSLLLNGY